VAEVSKMTFFNYFATKEDLVVGPMSEHTDELAETVRTRRADETPLEALHRHFLDGLARRDPVTGLCDKPNVLAVQRLIHETPSLLHRALVIMTSSQDAVANELGPGFGHRAAAAMITGARNALVLENSARLLAGETADALHPRAVANANTAFALLRSGL
jgi:AcrR family transcriptional regulator